MDDALPLKADTPESLCVRLGPSCDGAAELLGQMLEAYRPYLLQIANEEIDSDLRGKAGGSDLVQQTCLEATQDIASFRGKTEEELKAWLRRILLNNIANFRRQFRANGKRDVGREVPVDAVGNLRTREASASDQARAREENDAVEKAIMRLPEDYRQAIRLRHQQHRTFAEIGAEMGRSAEAARKLWARGIEALQAELAPSS